MSTNEMMQEPFRLPAKLRGPLALPPFTLLILAIGALQLALFLAIAPATQVLRPHSDMFDLIDAYFTAEKNGDWLHYLFQSHSYHRIPFFRALLALDITVFKGTGIPFLVSAYLCMAGIGLILARQALATPVQALRIPAAAAALVILVSASNVIHLSVPANTPYAHTLFFSILALHLAEPKDGADRSPVSWRRLCALVCVIAACFGTAIGFVLWPTLAIMAFRRGEADRRWLILLLAVGGAFSTAYVNGLTGETTAGSLDMRSLVKAADYFLAFLGLPWTRATLDGGRVVGLVMLAFSLLAITSRGVPGADRGLRFAQALILFSLGTAAMGAFGRQDMAETIVIPGRYNLLLVPMKVGLVLTVLPWLERQRHHRPRIVEAGVVAVFALFLAQQVVVARVVVVAAANLRETITAFNQGVRTEPMKMLIYPDFARAEALTAKMRARGLFFETEGRRRLSGPRLLMKVSRP